MRNKRVREKKLRGALIGYGFISSKGHVPAYLARKKVQDDVEIVAVADINETRRALVKSVLPEAAIYDSCQNLLDKEADRLDFIDICTPPCDHARIALAAFDKGLHVLCEKPITTTVEDARLMLERAAQVKRVFFPCHNYKHAPVVKTIQEIINSGKIGKVRSLTLMTYRNTHAVGVKEWQPHWRRSKEYSGGGIAMDHGSHTFYLTFDWLKSYPTAISAQMANLEPERYNTEDNLTAFLTFPTGIAHVHLTWTAGVRKVIYAIQGAIGAITVDDDDLQLAIMKKNNGSVQWDVEKRSIASDWMDASHVNWFNSLFDQFKKAIANHEYVGKEARESYLCIQLIAAAYRSAQEGSKEQLLTTEVFNG